MLSLTLVCTCMFAEPESEVKFQLDEFHGTFVHTLQLNLCTVAIN